MHGNYILSFFKSLAPEQVFYSVRRTPSYMQSHASKPVRSAGCLLNLLPAGEKQNTHGQRTIAMPTYPLGKPKFCAGETLESLAHG
jgi:hypothetical protein